MSETSAALSGRQERAQRPTGASTVLRLVVPAARDDRVEKDRSTYVTPERIPVDVDLQEAWLCTVEGENFGNVTTRAVALGENTDHSDKIDFPLNTLPEHITDVLEPGLQIFWHKALIDYSDGTRELAESFRVRETELPAAT